MLEDATWLGFETLGGDTTGGVFCKGCSGCDTGELCAEGGFDLGLDMGAGW